MLPLPDDAPAEIPKLIFRSKDNQWQLEMASSRLNYRWIQQTENQQVLPDRFCSEFVDFVNSNLKQRSPQQSPWENVELGEQESDS